MADDSQRLVSKLSMLLNDEAALERAFGAPGQAGDPDMLAHLALRWNSVYEEFFDWAARLRGSSAPSEYHKLLELLARYLDGPVRQYRGFVDEYVEKVDAVPAAIAAGNKVSLGLHIVISIPDEVTTAYGRSSTASETSLNKTLLAPGENSFGHPVRSECAPRRVGGVANCLRRNGPGCCHRRDARVMDDWGEERAFLL